MESNGLKHLDIARDAARMREIFQRTLQPLEHPAYTVESCALEFAREAVGRTLLQYALELRETGSGRLRRQIVSGVTYEEERARRMLARIHVADPSVRLTAAGDELPAIAYAPELQMVIQVFPYDHRLPALARLLRQRPAELAPVLEAELGPGEWRIEGWEAESLRYRVDMRATVRLEIDAREEASARDERRRLFAKVYRDADEGERAYALQRTLWDRFGESGEALTVARPIAYLGEMRTLLLDELPGERLLDILRLGETALPSVRRVGEAIAALHRLPVEGVLGARTRPPRDELARLRDISERLQAAVPMLRDAIVETVGVITDNFVDVPSAPTHFDLKPGHIMLGPNRVGVLDFDKLVAADPMVDVVGLLTHLVKERKLTRRQHEASAAVVSAFAEAYFADAPDSWRARLPACHALALLSAAATTGRAARGGVERAGRADRSHDPERLAALVQEAHGVVSGAPQ